MALNKFFAAKALVPGASNNLGEWVSDWVRIFSSSAMEAVKETKFGTKVLFKVARGKRMMPERRIHTQCRESAWYHNDTRRWKLIATCDVRFSDVTLLPAWSFRFGPPWRLENRRFTFLPIRSDSVRNQPIRFDSMRCLTDARISEWMY